MGNGSTASFATLTAFGTKKTSEDISVVHGLFTYDIPDSIFKIYENDIQLASTDLSTKVTTSNGELSVNSGATLSDKSRLESRRHPRLHPNRGQLYSPSIFLPSKTTLGTIRRFGTFTSDGGGPLNGCYFEWSQYDQYGTALPQNYLWACVVSNGAIQYKDKIEYENYIPDLDLEKGFLADIQFQWRGVGNYEFYLGNPENGRSISVHTINALGNRTTLTMANPALPISFEAINNGNSCILKSGCVDVSTEGGKIEKQEYCSTVSDGQATAVTDTPIMAIRVPPTYQSIYNTRDSQLHKIRVFTDNNKVDFVVWRTTDETALGGTATWTQVRSGISIEKKDATGGASTLTFNTAKAYKLDKGSCPPNSTVQIVFDEEEAPIFLTHGDIIILAATGTNALVSAVIVSGEEI